MESILWTTQIQWKQFHSQNIIMWKKNFKSTLFSEANGITIPTEHNLKWEKKIDQFVGDVTAFVGNSLKVKRDTQYVFQIPPMRLYLFFKK